MEKEKIFDVDKIFEKIIVENFQKLEIHINLQIQETQQSLNRKNSQKYIPTLKITKLLKTKVKKILKRAKYEKITEPNMKKPHIGKQ